jgi:hypothetical protein
MFKPFRPPLLNKKSLQDNIGESVADVPSSKRRRLNDNECDASVDVKREDVYNNGKTEQRLVFKVPGISSLPRKPLESVPNPAITSRASGQQGKSEPEFYYTVLWYVKRS